MKFATGPATPISIRLPARMRSVNESGVVVRPSGCVGRIARLNLPSPPSLARHLHVAAQRQQAQPVIGVTPAKAEQTLAEADGEDLHAHAAQLGDGKMAELVHQYHDAEHNQHGN